MSDQRLGCLHVPERFRDRFLDSVDVGAGKAIQAAQEAARRFVAGEFAALLISGPTGIGKSLIAACVCNELASAANDEVTLALSALGSSQAELARPSLEYPTIDLEAHSALMDRARTARARSDRGCPRWTSVPSLLGRLRREIGADERPAAAIVEHAMETRGLLVLDDLGAERPTEWTAATLFEISSERYDRMVRTIITSNLSADELDAAGYSRIVSRLADHGALLELSTAYDYRMKLRRSAI